MLRRETVLTDTPGSGAACSQPHRRWGQHMQECYRTESSLRAGGRVKGGAKFAENLSSQQPDDKPIYEDD